MKEPKPYLLNIIKGIDSIGSYHSDNEDEFMKDPKTQDAILMRLQDIGENLVHIRDSFPEFWATNSTDEWIKAVGLRNIISHGYAEIELDIIWSLITGELLKLKQSVQVLL